MTTQIKISVIIPNLHSPIVDKTIESVLTQETDLPFEIIVVGMDKWGLVEKYPQVNYIQTARPEGAAKARNIGIREAKGEWLFFIDSDCIAQQGWLEALFNATANGYLVVGGGVKSPSEPFWLVVCNLSMFYGELASQQEKERKFYPTLNLAVHREVVEHVGFMNEDLPRGQDIEWTARMTQAGYKLLFKPTAAIEHHPPRQDLKTLREYVRKSGYYMIDVRHTYPQIFNTPKILKKPIVWQLFGPFIAAWITLKIILQTKEVRQNLRIIPFIYLQKLSWCRGAAQRLRDGNEGEVQPAYTVSHSKIDE